MIRVPKRCTRHNRIAADGNRPTEPVLCTPVRCGQFGGLGHIGPASVRPNKDIRRPLMGVVHRCTHHNCIPADANRITEPVMFTPVRCGQLGHLYQWVYDQRILCTLHPCHPPATITPRLSSPTMPTTLCSPHRRPSIHCNEILPALLCQPGPILVWMNQSPASNHPKTISSASEVLPSRFQEKPQP